MPTSPPSDDRRGFLAKLLALGCGALAFSVPTFSAIAAFLNPWRQKAAAGQWVRAATLAALPEGKPQRCPIIADRSDAWNVYPAEPIGAVFLCRKANNEVVAMQSICPHNGGCVSFDEAKCRFSCPSHGAVFDVDGRRVGEKSVAPRDMDVLEVEVRNGQEVWVKFEKFQDGKAAKVVKT